MPNELTPEEQAQGWTLLFDGEDLRRWRGFRQDSVPAGWGVQEDAIYFDPSAEGGGDLITKDQYHSFELRLGWKISEGGNSGIMYRVSEEHPRTWHTGPEMQVLDDARHPNGKNPKTSAGAVYALYAPSTDAVKPAGAWNQVRIVVDGSHVEHWLNQEKIIEYELGGEEWKKRVADSKFADMPGFGQYERGHIALQDHGDEVWYRDVKIRLLK